MEKNIVEGNKLISDFYVKVLNNAEIIDGMYYSPKESCWVDEGKYHCLWDWIMPLIDDIWRMGYMVHVQYYQSDAGVCTCRIYSAAVHIPAWSGTGIHPIKSYFNAVIQFITWYNSKPQTK